MAVSRTNSAMKAALKPACPCGRTLVPLWRYDDLICPAGCRDDGLAASITIIRWYAAGVVQQPVGDLLTLGPSTLLNFVYTKKPPDIHTAVVEWKRGNQPQRHSPPFVVNGVEAYQWYGPFQAAFVAP
jgi:hypothetical protein